MPRLTYQEQKEIEKKIRQGMSYTAIAAEMKVSTSSVNYFAATSLGIQHNKPREKVGHRNPTTLSNTQIEQIAIAVARILKEGN